jgi:hypothetical protein
MSIQRPSPAHRERRFRDAMAQFATGVTIIAAPLRPGEFVGFTANSFNSVSLNPPLIAWSLARHSRSLAAFESGATPSAFWRTTRPSSRAVSRARTPTVSPVWIFAWARPARR